MSKFMTSLVWGAFLISIAGCFNDDPRKAAESETAAKEAEGTAVVDASDPLPTYEESSFEGVSREDVRVAAADALEEARLVLKVAVAATRNPQSVPGRCLPMERLEDLAAELEDAKAAFEQGAYADAGWRAQSVTDEITSHTTSPTT